MIRATTAAWTVAATTGALTAAATAVYVGSVTGTVAIDLRIARRVRPLGPLVVNIAAPREIVYAVLAEPYLGRQTRAVAAKVQILDRGTDMVLADHITALSHGLSARTTETVRFTPPDHIDFRLVRGPVPHVVERFQLTETPDGTRLEYHGELGTDLGRLGRRWAAIVAPRWEAVVADTFAAVRTEAERRAGLRGTDGRAG